MLGDLCFRITDKAKERGHHMELICKKCLLREMAEADAAMIKKYVDAIKGEDRVPEKEYEARLAVCKACDRLNAEPVMHAAVMWSFGRLQAFRTALIKSGSTNKIITK